MSIITKQKCLTIFAITALSFLFCVIYAENSCAEISTNNILNTVLEKYETATSSWGIEIEAAATRLFVSLTAISMVWTFAQLLFHRSSFAEFFGELIRFMVFTGFYLWLLRKAPVISAAIIKSLRMLGEQASGQQNLQPSKIVDIGFEIFSRAVSNISLTSPIISSGCLVVSIIVLLVLALVAVNMLLQLCSAWILAYAGIIFLGFGGSRWTSDMAINYYKTVLGIGASLMTMTLIVGVGTDIIKQYHKGMSKGDLNLEEAGIILVLSITLLLLTDKLPALVSGIITGASIGSNAGGSFGAGAAMTAGMAAGGAAMSAGSVASGAASMAGRTALAGAANVAGMVSALKAASQKAGEGDSGKASGLANAMGTKSPSAADIGKVLGKAAGGMAGQAVSNMKQGFADRAANTIGGRMASAIKGENNKGGKDA